MSRCSFWCLTSEASHHRHCLGSACDDSARTADLSAHGRFIARTAGLSAYGQIYCPYGRLIGARQVYCPYGRFIGARQCLKCPFCGHENTRVIDSRPAEDNNSIRRRRVCDECDKRFTTYEKIETIPLIVIKKDDNRETYDRSKIEAGVLRACHKRPISVNQIKQLVDEVETEIFSGDEKEIPSRVIGELVMNKLKDLEAVAYVRFASVYREFKDINTFMDELKKVLE